MKIMIETYRNYTCAGIISIVIFIIFYRECIIIPVQESKYNTPLLQDVGIEYLVVVLKNSIFPNGYRPTHHTFDADSGKGGGFEVRFNYPRQVFRSDFTAKWIWENLGNNATDKWVGMTFKVKNIEVLKRRSKYGLPCNKDWKHDDEKIMESMIQKLQCEPPHWNVKPQKPFCSKVM